MYRRVVGKGRRSQSLRSPLKEIRRRKTMSRVVVSFHDIISYDIILTHPLPYLMPTSTCCDYYDYLVLACL